MKAYPLIAKILSIESVDEDMIEIDVSIIRSALTGYDANNAEESKSMLFRISNKTSRYYQPGDTIKIVMYMDREIKSMNDIRSMKVLKRRVEIMHEGDDMWNLIEEKDF